MAGRVEKVKNVVLVGQGGVGKTMLAEAMLHLTGRTTRLGGHAGTKPTLDYDAEEGSRGFSISTTIAPVTWEDTRINVLDAPCYPDFVGDAYAAMSAGETTLFMVDSTGPQTTTTRLWFAADELSVARAVFVNRLDKDDADFDLAMESLREHFGNRLGAVTIPMGTGSAFSGVIDVVHQKARHLVDGKPEVTDVPAEFADAAASARADLVDLVVEVDDELMMKYLEGEEISEQELEGLLARALRERVFVPVFAGSCVKEEGVVSLLDAIVNWFPTMADFGRIPLVNGEQLDISPDDDRPVAFVFKSLNDPQNGRLSFLKVLAGTLEPGLELTNARTRKAERLGHLYLMCGKETQDVKSAASGDIVVVPKLEAITGDTLSVTGKVEAAQFRFPNSLYRIAIEPDKRGTEDKLYTFLDKAADADPTLKVERVEDTGQTVISAIGEAQVSVLLDRLEDRVGITAHTVKLKIPYRETIRRVASAEGRHKKQTGGAGQFGDCWLRVEPNPGQGYEFVDEVVGGHIPRNFIPAIDKGVRETMADGVLAGYPMIDIKVAVYDGSYHPVDSNDMAFQTAARLAYQDGIPKAKPTILEPIGLLKVTIPDENLGDIMSDISSKRRGTVLGMNAEDGMQIVEAEVPMAEMSSYTIDLRSMTQGRGSFSCKFVRYEEAPGNVQQKVIEEAKALAEAE